MGVYRKLKQNKRGRDFVVGDIHGTFRQADRALEKLGFDPEKDRLLLGQAKGAS